MVRVQAAARDLPQAPDLSAAAPLGLLAVRLLGLAREAGEKGLIHVASSERRASGLERILQGLAPGLEIVSVPPWDCLPYDRASPSRRAMGRRMAALRRLAHGSGTPRLVLTTPDALLQRVLPRNVCADACLRLEAGQDLDLDRFEALLDRFGYLLDERVDEPGEAALRGKVIELFPAAEVRPYRLEHDDGRIAAIRAYDPLTQRTTDAVGDLLIGPATELIRPEAPGEAAEPGAGLEHWLPEFVPTLETLFDYLPEAALVIEPKAEGRRLAALEQIGDAYRGRSRLRPERASGRMPLPPERLYLEGTEWDERLAGRAVIRLNAGETEGVAPNAVPRFVEQPHAGRAFASFVQGALKGGRRVVLTGVGRHLKGFVRRAEQRLETAPAPAADWDAVLAAPKGAVLALALDLDAGFVDESDGVVVVAAADLLGSRAEGGADAEPGPSALPFADADFHVGDAVIHVDHGMAALEGLEAIAAGGVDAGDAVRLRYAGEDKSMTPVLEMGRIWRYGSDAEAVSLDRLDGGAWAKRRAGLEAELAETAQKLVRLAREREVAESGPLVPPRRDYERFVARFPFAETPDQARAIEAVLRDLAAGRPMDRLVCGDVGFGKTEVALRAAAAVALAGKQVAVVAPTTVLVRQHLETFRRRFADLGVEIGHLSRLVKPAEAKAAKERLADGGIGVIVGTHALAAKGVRFKNLGLVVIDEEQRFGASHKARLRDLAKGVHVLSLTATPIPRTLQAAMVGLQDLSIIATPPARRQPIRTFLVPFDPVTVREALVREKRRGGQSFLVCPRIKDIEPMANRLSALCPELEVLVAHGKMPPAEMDETMVRFAEGEGDVLLATNIIESGLDVPQANTMLVWRADRFGLAQLHQLRGRVGRGRARGVCYLLTEPETKLPPATEKRLRTLEALDRLGAGFAISARDLDLRGAGDLLGEEQAGHVKLVGVGLYQHLLERALRAAKGESVDEDWTPELNLGLSGRIPESYAPEPEVRINLYARLARVDSAEGVDALAEEIEDRFGPLPDEMRHLLDLVRLRRRCVDLGIARVDAGPQAIALSFRPGAAARVGGVVEASRGDLEWRGERLVLKQGSETDADRSRLVAGLMDRLG